MNAQTIIARCGNAVLVKDAISVPYARGPIGYIRVRGKTVAAGQWRYISKTKWVEYLSRN